MGSLYCKEGKADMLSQKWILTHMKKGRTGRKKGEVTGTDFVT